jgi:hypothetical protein
MLLPIRLDERDHLVEVQYQESRAYLALSNLPKARAALFAAKTTANSIYVPPSVQVTPPCSIGTFLDILLGTRQVVAYLCIGRGPKLFSVVLFGSFPASSVSLDSDNGSPFPYLVVFLLSESGIGSPILACGRGEGVVDRGGTT